MIETAQRPTSDTAITVGTCVQTGTYGYRGVVTKVHEGCPEGPGWIAGQSVPIRVEAKDEAYPWFSVLVHGGGSVAVPLYDVQVVETFEVDNLWLDEYVTVAADGTYQPV